MTIIPDNTDKDLELLAGLKEKDEGAFTLLVKRYESPLFYMIYQMVNNRLDAEDLVIETFMKVFLNINRFVPKYLFSTWLFTVGRNTSLDFIKKRSINSLMIDNIDDIKNYIESESPNPEQIIIHKEQKKRIRTALKNLEEKYRNIIMIRCINAYTESQTEEVLGINGNVAGVHLFRARKLLKESLKE